MQIILCISASIGGIFLKIHFFYFTHFAISNVSFVVIRRQLSALYLKINIPCCPINGFHEMDLLENPHLSPHTHYIHAVYTGYVRTIVKDIPLA